MRPAGDQPLGLIIGLTKYALSNHKQRRTSVRTYYRPKSPPNNTILKIFHSTLVFTFSRAYGHFSGYEAYVSRTVGHRFNFTPVQGKRGWNSFRTREQTAKDTTL
jgi:hypothetical protein